MFFTAVNKIYGVEYEVNMLIFKENKVNGEIKVKKLSQRSQFVLCFMFCQ